MVHKDELMKMTEGQLQLEGKKIAKLEAVNAVLLQDILLSITPTTIILKIDIEGYECKVGALVSNSIPITSQGVASAHSSRRNWQVHSCHLFGVGQGGKVKDSYSTACMRIWILFVACFFLHICTQ